MTLPLLPMLSMLPDVAASSDIPRDMAAGDEIAARVPAETPWINSLLQQAKELKSPLPSAESPAWSYNNYKDIEFKSQP